MNKNYYVSMPSNSSSSEAGWAGSEEARSLIALVIVFAVIGIVYYANRGEIYSSPSAPNPPVENAAGTQLTEPIPNTLTSPSDSLSSPATINNPTT